MLKRGNMTPEEVTRRNEAIALFMDWQYSMGVWWSNVDEGGFPHEVLYFDVSWDDLMPVVEKMIMPQNPALGDLCIVPLGNGQVRVHFSENQTGTVYHYSTSMIEAVWMAVSEWVLARETPEKQQQKV